MTTPQPLNIGIPAEVKPFEKRVALTPAECAELIGQRHTILLQSGAGEAAGFADAHYAKVGVEVVKNASSLYAGTSLIVKVKEPQAEDLSFLKKHHTLFCYLHLAAEPKLVEKLCKIGCTAIGFETVVVKGATPLLAPMSAIAGRLAVQIGTWHLHAPRGGRGVLLGGIRGQGAGKVLILGAGVAGTEAATLAHHMGANVMVADISKTKLESLEAKLPGITTTPLTPSTTPELLAEILPSTDLLIGAVYVVGKHAPVLLQKADIMKMPKGAVVVDISIDQGGCFTTSKPCTHANPVYSVGGVLHSAITNLPAAAPHTASRILAKTILPYVSQIAENHWSSELENAINIADGQLLLEL